jgi:hypothetical protein
MQKSDLLKTLDEIWVVKFRESESGWGSDTWTIWYDSLEEARKDVRDVNKKNPVGRVPDYYICADEPVKFTEFYKIDRS